MGYGIPAALGAKVAFPYRKVVAVVGDGCFQMSGMELASAKQEKLPIVIVLINDNCLTLIKATQQRRYQERYIAVDLQNPDFERFAQAFGVRYWRVEKDADFEGCFREALECEDVALVGLLVETGARIAWSAAPRVVTSARIASRVRGGFGDTLVGLVTPA